MRLVCAYVLSDIRTNHFNRDFMLCHVSLLITFNQFNCSLLL